MGLAQPQKPIRDVINIRDHGGSTSVISGTYVTLSCYDFRGTDIVLPLSIKVIMWADEGKGIGCKIYDMTNDTTIAEVADQTGNTAPTLIDLGTLSNLSAGAAIWEVMFKKSSGVGGTAYTASMNVDY